MSKSSRKLMDVIIFAGFGLSGAAALIYEVVWTRNLSTVMGSSTYALSTLLAAFMGGLSLGGFLGGKLAARTDRPAYAFALIEVGIGVSGLITLALINAMTPVYIKSYFAFHMSFAIFSVVQFLINFLIMGVPTTLMGMTFPVVIKYFSDDQSDIGRVSGNLYSINTMGAIIGAVSAGFLLIPCLGIYAATFIGISLNLLTAVAVFLIMKRNILPIAGAVLAGLIVTGVLDSPKIPLLSYYMLPRYETYEGTMSFVDGIGSNLHTARLFFKPDVEGDVYLLDRSGSDEETALVNGSKLEGGDDEGFALLALLPYFSAPAPSAHGKALNIGLGSGRTLKHLAGLPYDKIDSVELNQAIIDVNKEIMSPDLFSDRRIDHIRADGRNFLMLEERRYDNIVVSPSWAVDMGSAGLLTDEFFQLAQTRLERSGSIAVWTDFNMLTPGQADIILRTVRRTFPYCTAWRANTAMIVVASRSPLRPATEVMASVDSHNSGLVDLYTVYKNQEQVRNIARGQIHTDNKPILEFIIARNLIAGL